MKLIIQFLQWIWQRTLLVLKELRSSPFTTLIVLLVVSAGVLGSGILQVIGTNYNTYFKKTLEKFPPNSIVVTPGKKTGKPDTPISEKDLVKINRLPGVKITHPFMDLNIPIQVRISLPPLLFGKNAGYRSDLVAIGVPFSLIKSDLEPAERKKWLGWTTNQEVPLMVPRKLVSDVVELMLRSNNMPSINPNLFIGYKGTLLFGISSFKQLPNYQTLPARLVAFSDAVEDTALILPLSVVKEYNKRFLGEEKASQYSHVIVEVESHLTLLEVNTAIRKLGYNTEVGTGESKRLLQMQGAVNQFVAVITTIVLILAIIAIAFSSVIATLQRVDYFRILRVIGASNLFLTFTIFIKAALIGLAGAGLGLFLVNRLPGMASQYLGNISDFLSLPGFTINPYLGQKASRKILQLGILIPLLSTIPALFILYVKGLNRD